MNRIIISCFLISFCHITVWTQERHERLQSFVKNVNTFSYIFPQEKVYLHFDNTGYYAGETIFFQSYIVTAETHALSGLSGVLYVELLDASGKTVENKKLKIENGRAPGNFTLKNDISPGFYEIRAYTRCMLNFGDDVIFSRVFPVFGKQRTSRNDMYQMPENIAKPGKNEIRKTPESLSRINLSFHPEGGYMVTGLPGRIAFKATDSRGESIEIKGEIYNSSGELITWFSTLHNGMGFFSLRPDGGRYTAEVTYGNKKERFRLPDALLKGYTMMVTQRAEYISVKIDKTPELLSENLGISLSCRGKVYAFESFETEGKEQIVVSFSKEKLPSGVFQLTLFNIEGNIISERLVFINKEAIIRITPTNIITSFNTWSPIRINFAVNDAAGQAVETSFSLSIRDVETEPPSNYSGNVLTNLLLSSDLKGYIEAPEWYFDEQNTQRFLALDLLMLTQGWRRYPWDVMAGVKPFKLTQYAERNILIEGSVLDPTRDRPLKNWNITMWMYSMTEAASQRGECPTDDDGKFNFALEDFYGMWDLFIQTKEKGKRKQSRILLDRDINPDPRIIGYTETQIPEKKENVDEFLQQIVEDPDMDIDIFLPDSTHRFEEVVVAAKRWWRQENVGLRWADVVYNVQDEVDKLRDKGNTEAGSLLEFLLSKPDFSYMEKFPHRVETYVPGRWPAQYVREMVYLPTITYKMKPVVFIVNNLPAILNSMYGGQIEYAFMTDVITYDENDTIPPTYICAQTFYSYIVNDLLTDEIETVMIDASSGIAATQLPTCYDDKDKYVIVHIYRNSDGKPRTSAKDIRSTKIQGFSRPLEFYSPDYSQKSLPNERDVRRTLYWDPDVTTDANGKATVNFFNNTSCKVISISAETVTQDGKIGVY